MVDRKDNAKLSSASVLRPHDSDQVPIQKTRVVNGGRSGGFAARIRIRLSVSKIDWVTYTEMHCCGFEMFVGDGEESLMLRLPSHDLPS